jgi:hypothetical protein
MWSVNGNEGVGILGTLLHPQFPFKDLPPAQTQYLRQHLTQHPHVAKVPPAHIHNIQTHKTQNTKHRGIERSAWNEEEGDTTWERGKKWRDAAVV